MTWSEQMEDLHRIREDIFKDLEGMTPEERMAHLNQESERIAKLYHLKLKTKQPQGK